MTALVGLVGPAGAGKSSVADRLVGNYGANRYSLAAPLKEIARHAMGFSHEQVWGTQAEKEAVDPRYGFSPRWFLQRLGTEGFRAKLGRLVWVNELLRRVNRDAPGLAVVDDARFVSEAEGFVYWSRRPGAFINVPDRIEGITAEIICEAAFGGTAVAVPADIVERIDHGARLALGADVWERDHTDPLSSPGATTSIWRLHPPGDDEAATRAAAAGQHVSEAEWLSVRADVEIAPAVRGLEFLFEQVDRVARALGFVSR